MFVGIEGTKGDFYFSFYVLLEFELFINHFYVCVYIYIYIYKGFQI